MSKVVPTPVERIPSIPSELSTSSFTVPARASVPIIVIGSFVDKVPAPVRLRVLPDGIVKALSKVNVFNVCRSIIESADMEIFPVKVVSSLMSKIPPDRSMAEAKFPVPEIVRIFPEETIKLSSTVKVLLSEISILELLAVWVTASKIVAFSAMFRVPPDKIIGPRILLPDPSIDKTPSAWFSMRALALSIMPLPENESVVLVISIADPW